VIGDDGLLLVDDIGSCPQLAARSRGQYDSRAFAVVRVPLRARGQAIGVLTVTEREGAGEFTARDRKVLEALSAVGASALMNCRLHAAMNRQIMGTIQALASAVDAKDHYTHSHSRRVADLALATARELRIEGRARSREIELAGLLHDIGKIGIPDHVLSKRDRLTAEEYAIMKTHAQIGASIVARVDGLEPVSELILHHHERYDGLGYPAGLSGDEIPIGSALISAADTFDSLTSNRPYSRAVSPQQALGELRRCRSTQFNPAVVDAFVAAIDKDSVPQEG
jgi:putative nucleotidyltransferase with HDIG domain